MTISAEVNIKEVEALDQMLISAMVSNPKLTARYMAKEIGTVATLGRFLFPIIYLGSVRLGGPEGEVVPNHWGEHTLHNSNRTMLRDRMYEGGGLIIRAAPVKEPPDTIRADIVQLSIVCGPMGWHARDAMIFEYTEKFWVSTETIKTLVDMICCVMNAVNVGIPDAPTIQTYDLMGFEEIRFGGQSIRGSSFVVKHPTPKANEKPYPMDEPKFTDPQG